MQTHTPNEEELDKIQLARIEKHRANLKALLQKRTLIKKEAVKKLEQRKIEKLRKDMGI